MKPSVLVPLALALALPSLARADLPPPPGYVESCTVEKQQGPGDECLVCGDAYHGDVDACERKHAATGHTRRCRTSGASVWQEVWCKGGAKTDPAPTETKDVAAPPASPTPARSGSCSVVDGSGGGWLLIVLGLAFARPRRRLR